MATTRDTARTFHRAVMSLRADAERSRDPRDVLFRLETAKWLDSIDPSNPHDPCTLHALRIASAKLGEICDD